MTFHDVSQEDEEGITRSVSLLHGIIEEQIAKGVASERIIVGGFSQGGAVALLVTDSSLLHSTTR